MMAPSLLSIGLMVNKMILKYQIVDETFEPTKSDDETSERGRIKI